MLRHPRTASLEPPSHLLRTKHKRVEVLPEIQDVAQIPSETWKASPWDVPDDVDLEQFYLKL